MAEFFVIEEHTPLPSWLAHRIGAYLPARTRDTILCGAKGQIEAHHDITSERGQKRAVLRLRQAQEKGIVCAVIADKMQRQAIARDLTAPLATGSILSAALRLAHIVSEADCQTERIVLDGADSALGRAVAVYLAKRVRFLSLIGRSETSLRRLARCLWQTEGIAVRIGTKEGDRIIKMDDLTADGDCLIEGRCTALSVAECALFAHHLPCARYDHITARTLAETAELARARGISIWPKKGALAGQIRLTNEPSANII